ncbi:MAG: hypothetical protein DVB26_03845, partial [Verrucomicrobia bacterium]
MTTTTITYDDASVRRFMIASICWAIIGMTLGVMIGSQLSWWQMNGHILEVLTKPLHDWLTTKFGWDWWPFIQTDGISFLTFGRLRPLHTNA